MSRPRGTGLESPRARSEKKKRIPAYWARLGKGQHLGYRRGATSGFWLARLTDPETRQRIQIALGPADDSEPADGKTILTFDQASAKAREWFDETAKRKRDSLAKAAKPRSSEVTVVQAVEDYLDYLNAEKKGGKEAEYAVRKYILLNPIGQCLVTDLTQEQLEAFRKAITETPRGTRAKGGKTTIKNRRTKGTDGSDKKKVLKTKLELELESMSPEDLEKKRVRQRKSTCNRVMTNLKSALNRLVGPNSSIDDRAWRSIKPYRNVDGIRTEILEVVEQRSLIAVCPPGFRELVMGALYTGARYGELRTMRIYQIFPASNSIRIEDSKTSEPRTIPLSAEGSQFFAALIKDRKKSDYVFLRPDGEPWGRSHTYRPSRLACNAAGIKPVAFHELRHSYASQLIMAGAELTAVAKALGHKDTRMVEKHYGHLREGWVHKQIHQYSPQLFPEQNTPEKSDKAEAVITNPSGKSPTGADGELPPAPRFRRTKEYSVGSEPKIVLVEISPE